MKAGPYGLGLMAPAWWPLPGLNASVNRSNYTLVHECVERRFKNDRSK